MAQQFRSLAKKLQQVAPDSEMLLQITGEKTGLEVKQIVEVRMIVPESRRILVRHRNGWHRTLEFAGDFAVKCRDIDGDPGTNFQLSFS